MTRAGRPAVARTAVAGPTRTRRTRRDDGAAAVEMALVLPLLLFVLFGIIDFGRLLNAKITLTEAAREGARAAALHQDANARVGAATSDSLRGVTVTTTIVTACPAAGSVTDNAVVTAVVTLDFITPLAALAPLVGGSMISAKTLKGTGVMPCVG